MTLEIKNPTYDDVFKELFGPTGTPVNNFGPEDRVMSLVNQVLGPKFVNEIEYRDTTSDKPYSITFRYDVHFFCNNQNTHFDLEMQKEQNSKEDYYGRAELYGSRILQDNLRKGKKKYFHIPNVCVLSFLAFIIDPTLPAIFDAQQIEPNSKTILSHHLRYFYIQLPLIKQQGSQSKWLQLLAEGYNKGRKITINKAQYRNDRIISSSLVLLNAMLKRSDFQALHQAYISSLEEPKLTATVAKRLIREHSNQIPLILTLKLQARSSVEDIARYVNMDVNFVNLILSIAELSQRYIYFCNTNQRDPNKHEFLEIAKSRFELPDNVIQAIYAKLAEQN